MYFLDVAYNKGLSMSMVAISITGCSSKSLKSLDTSVKNLDGSEQKPEDSIEILSKDYKVWVYDIELPVYVARVQDSPFDLVTAEIIKRFILQLGQLLWL